MSFKSLTLYPTPKCQLDCVFCPLTKMPYLSEMDKEFEQSYKDEGYYVRKLLELGWENIKDIHRIEFWGGEPTLALHRTYNTVREIIPILPKLNQFYFSTNFTSPSVDDEIEGLVDVCGEFPDRDFYIRIQLSIDGPPEITDYSRGKGVTDKFLKNYNHLMDLKWFSEKYPNVYIQTVYKPTLDTTTVKKFLDIGYMESYYKWLEDNLYDVAVYNATNKYKPSIKSVPNLATPMEASKKDGIDFAEIEKNALKLSIENPFKYYDNIVMYSRNRIYQYKNRVMYCGVGRGIVEILPNNKYCACHRAFLGYCDEYRNLLDKYNIDKVIDERGMCNNQPLFIFDSAKEFLSFCDRTKYPTTGSSTFLNSQGIIKYLSKIGQIDEKYQNSDKAFEAANMMSEYVSQCTFDSYSVCGTQMGTVMSQYRMFLNGAIDVIKVATERMNSYNNAKSI